MLNKELVVTLGTPTSTIAFRLLPTKLELLVEGVSLIVINLVATTTTQPSTLKPLINILNIII